MLVSVLTVAGKCEVGEKLAEPVKGRWSPKVDFSKPLRDLDVAHSVPLPSVDVAVYP